MQISACIAKISTKVTGVYFFMFTLYTRQPTISIKAKVVTINSDNVIVCTYSDVRMQTHLIEVVN